MAHEPKIGLVEIFRSCQGEGYNTGRDAIFIRFAGCNLSCAFAPGVLCDTPYQRATVHLTLDELLTTVQDMATWRWQVVDKERTPMVILTGGEPTLQPQFDTIVAQLLQLHCYLAVETNGTTWKAGLHALDWISVSPKVDVPQGSPSPFHNPHPRDPALAPQVVDEMRARRHDAGEYRYVVASATEPHPRWYPAFRHYVSPALRSDGTGLEWKHGFPGFAPGALERCQEIVASDPRWRISTQVHKLWGVR